MALRRNSKWIEEDRNTGRIELAQNILLQICKEEEDIAGWGETKYVWQVWDAAKRLSDVGKINMTLADANLQVSCG